MANKQTQEIIRQITDHYDASVARLRDALTAYLKDRTLPDMADRAIGAFAYPELVIRYHGTQRGNVANLAFGRLEKPGTYCITLTRPEIFKDYLESQIDLLVDQYELEMHVRPGKQEIPFPYVLDGLELGDGRCHLGKPGRCLRVEQRCQQGGGRRGCLPVWLERDCQPGKRDRQLGGGHSRCSRRHPIR